MVIDTAASLQFIHQNNRTENAFQKILKKLSTAKRINTASDDAAMMSIAAELEKQVRGFSVAENNIADAMSVLRISDGASDSVTQLLQRQRELSIQASNATVGTEGRKAINNEIQQLSQEIDRISSSAQYNNQRLIDGSGIGSGNAEIQVGTQATETDRVALPAQDLRASTLGVDTLDVTTGAGRSTAITSIDEAIRKVNASRTTAGAAYNRLESTYRNAQNTRVNTADALSRAEDLDYAAGVAEQSRLSVLQQTNISAMSNFNDIAKNNMLSLLQ